jgi:hypothetical protein
VTRDPVINYSKQLQFILLPLSIATLAAGKGNLYRKLRFIRSKNTFDAKQKKWNMWIENGEKELAILRQLQTPLSSSSVD